MQVHARGDLWRDVLQAITDANEEGLVMRAQVATRAIGILVGLQATLNPLAKCASFGRVAGLPLAEQVATLRDPSLRSTILGEYRAAVHGLTDNLESTFVLTDPPDYEPPPSASVAAMAAQQGVRPDELLYDLLLEDDGRRLLYVPIINYASGDLRVVGEMLEHPHTVPALGDGGAHVGII